MRKSRDKKTGKSVEGGDYYRSLFLNTRDGIFVLKDMRFVECNPRALEMYGHSREEILGRSPLDFSPETQPDGRKSRDVVAEKLDLTLSGGAQHFEWQHERSDGTKFDVEVSVSSIDVAEGTLLLAIVRDITERKCAEDALQAESDRAQKYLDLAGVMFVALDVAGKITMINRRGCTLLECSEEDAVGADWFDNFIPEDVREKVRRVFKCLMAEDVYPVEYYENSIITRKGNVRAIAWHNTVVRDARGYITGTLSSGENITERKMAESALRESEAKYRNLIEQIPSVAWSADANEKTIFISPSVEKILGFTPQQIYEGGEEFWGEHMHPDESGMLREAFADLREKGTPVDEEYRLRHADGRWIWVRGQTSIKLKGAPTGGGQSYGVFYDITERKLAEEELQKAFAEIQRLKEQAEAENVYLREEIRLVYLHGGIVGQSSAMASVLGQAERVAPTDSTVLLLGETGTGKELLARAIHDMSGRKGHPLVIVNCAAIPPALIESELFGREKGAYTGALTKQMGRFEVADKSTVFLDEIAEVPPELQVKLLRVLQEGEFERLGSTRSIRVDVRVIAATNRNLEKEVDEGRFRDDLFYRLNVFPITIPPLRERKEDIPALVWAFVNEFSEMMGKRIESISRKNMDSLNRYSWPGNVRELRNAVERAMIRADGKSLHINIPGRTDRISASTRTLVEVEREHISRILEFTSWRVRGKGGAADVLGLKPTTLDSRMAKLGIRRPLGSRGATPIYRGVYEISELRVGNGISRYIRCNS